MSFAKGAEKKIGINTGKKIMNTATKTVKNVKINAEKTAPKKIVQKTAQANGDLF